MGSNEPRLWVRADASPRIGIGHVMRSMALIEAAMTRGRAVTAVTGVSSLGARLFERFGIKPVDPAGETWVESVRPRDLVVWDGYLFDDGPRRAARARHGVVGVIDDFPDGKFTADLVVNPGALSAPAYQLPAQGTILWGPNHALVRRQILARRRARGGDRARLLVTLGGSDTRLLGPGLAARANATGAFGEVVLIQGPAAPRAHPKGVQVVRDPPEFADLLDRADAVITAAGATTWELLAMGMPVAVVATAANQRLIVQAVVGAAAALEVLPDDGDAALAAVVVSLADAGVQRGLSEAGRTLVDGLGATRVMDALEQA